MKGATPRGPIVLMMSSANPSVTPCATGESRENLAIMRASAQTQQARSVGGRMLPGVSLSDEWLYYNKPFAVSFPGAPASLDVTAGRASLQVALPRQAVSLIVVEW